MAFQASSNSNELRDLIDRGAGLNTGNGSMRPPVPAGYNAQRPIATAITNNDQSERSIRKCQLTFLKAKTG